MDTNSLFHRLIILVERSTNISAYFCNELTPVPTALFKEEFMCKTDKPALITVMNSLAMNMKKSSQTICEVIYDNEDIDWIREEEVNMVTLSY